MFGFWVSLVTSRSREAQQNTLTIVIQAIRTMSGVDEKATTAAAAMSSYSQNCISTAGLRAHRWQYLEITVLAVGWVFLLLEYRGRERSTCTSFDGSQRTGTMLRSTIEVTVYTSAIRNTERCSFGNIQTVGWVFL